MMCRSCTVRAQLGKHVLGHANLRRSYPRKNELGDTQIRKLPAQKYLGQEAGISDLSDAVARVR